jgi:hypothetical protein
MLVRVLMAYGILIFLYYYYRQYSTVIAEFSVIACKHNKDSSFSGDIDSFVNAPHNEHETIQQSWCNLPVLTAARPCLKEESHVLLC